MRFDATVANGTPQTIIPYDFVWEAMAAGSYVTEISYGDVNQGGGKSIPPGQTLTFAVGFEMPDAQPVPFRVIVRRNHNDNAPAIFEGEA